MPRALLQRDPELAVLERWLGDVRAGTGRVIVVEGPAGIGKSTLLATAARGAAESGMRVLRAWGGPLERDAGWGIARQLFAPVRSGAEWPDVTIGAAGLAGRVLDLDEAEPALGGDAMHAAAHGLTWLASNLADRGPTLLTVDDAHWADAPSLRWLAGLARQLTELRLGILCAVRSGEPPAEPVLLAELLAASPDAPVRPRPLGPGAVAVLVRERLPTAGPGFAHACHAATAGNPFLLAALLDQLVSEDVQPTDDVAERLSAFGPEQVGRVVERQLARLPDGAAALARAFAVLGRDAPLRLACQLAGLDQVSAAELAGRLAAAGLLGGQAGRYALVHPLVAGALYNGMPGAERAVRHAEAARILSGERADPEAVALHLVRSEPERDAQTVDALRTAARRASLRGAPESAAVFLRRALAEPPPDRAVEADVRSELGIVLAAHLQADAPLLLREAVDMSDLPDQRSRIALSGSRALGLAGRFEEAIQLCRRGLEYVDGVSPPLLARLEAELVCNAWLRAPTVTQAREQQHRIASSTPPSPLWWINAAWQSMMDGRPANEARALLDLALAGGALEGEPDSLLATTMKFALIACGDLPAAEQQCDALIDRARPRGWLIALAHGSFMRAIVRFQAGRIRAAEADARLSFDYKVGVSPPDALIWSVFPLVDALTELGELAGADAVLAEAGQLADPPVGALASPMLLESRARLRSAQGRHPEAHADLLAAAERWRELGIRHPGVAMWRVDDARVLVMLGDLSGARRIAEEHLELAATLGLAGPRGAGLRALAATVPRVQAVDLLEQAVDLLASSTAQLEHTRALVDLGAALRRANRRADARDPLRCALELADRDGMLCLAARARDELRATGARPRRSALHGVESLTPAEYRVAALAAEGHSNPEIAQQLYVTRRTVETHLTHVFQKLGLTTRAELAHGFCDRPSAATPAPSWSRSTPRRSPR
jgi:DNA-binding CsgD family transcriptional regulator